MMRCIYDFISLFEILQHKIKFDFRLYLLSYDCKGIVNIWNNLYAR